MIPYKDDNPTAHFPVITILLIVVNTLVFLYQISSNTDSRAIVYSYGVIPYNLLHGNEGIGIPIAINIFTSMFLHGGTLHLAGNMLYLWIFGNNIEDKLGIFRFIIFYLLCGVIATYTHALTDPSSRIPMIGASGAISGILGAYLVLFPRARIHTLIFFGFFIQVIKIPAIIVIGFWIVIQFMNGILSKGIYGGGGVAWFAHIGGFLAGIILIKLFFRKRRLTQ
ncbi:MAG: rhomboid family intramembrane serine protease [Nitrospirota bacterium]